MDVAFALMLLAYDVCTRSHRTFSRILVAKRAIKDGEPIRLLRDLDFTRKGGHHDPDG